MEYKVVETFRQKSKYIRLLYNGKRKAKRNKTVTYLNEHGDQHIPELIPRNHPFQNLIKFCFIYNLAAPYRHTSGCPSIKPVSMFEMMLVGYLYSSNTSRLLV